MNTQSLHQAALALAKSYRETDAKLLEVLSHMQESRSFYELGYTGIFEYCFKALGLTEASSYYFQKVTHKALEVPALKAAMAQWTLSLSVARLIEPVITQANSEEWLKKADALSHRELEREVSRANPNARAKKLSLLEKNIARLSELLAKGKEDVLIQATEALLDKVDPERRAERAVLSARKPKPAKTPVATQVRLPIPAAVKHQVVLEQGYQCAKCHTGRHLHYHHLQPVSAGGQNLPENLELLCSAHHRIAHTRAIDSAI